MKSWVFPFLGLIGLASTQSAAAGACVTPVITSQQDVQPYLLPNPTTFGIGANDVGGTVGIQSATYQIIATGSPTSYSATLLPPGLSLNTSTGAITGTPTTANTWFTTITASNACGTGTALVIFVIVPVGAPPVITSQQDVQPDLANNPLGLGLGAYNVLGTVGIPFVTYQIAASGSPTSFGATNLPAGLTLNTVSGAINGTPSAANTWFSTITATNAVGTGTALVIFIISPQSSSRIMNFSARALTGPGSQALTLGFIVSGSNKTLLVRGIGPALVPFGVANALPDPQLTLFGGGALIASNAGWQTNVSAAGMPTLAVQIGAFPLANGSNDSAMIPVVNAGAYTAQIVGASNDTGVALAEVYDADFNFNAHLANASVRTLVNGAVGNPNPLVIGFVIGGNAQKTVLIRGVGPTLAAFGVAGALANPQITLYLGAIQLASNASWSVGTNAAQITAAFAQVGAFALPVGSLDAALLITLQPGTYTVQMSGVGNSSGVALVEVFDVM